MGESFQRGDFLTRRGVSVIDDALDLCPGNVGGHIVPIYFTINTCGDNAAVEMLFSGATITEFVAPKDGSIVGMSYRLASACQAGWATFTAYIGATASEVIILENRTEHDWRWSTYVWGGKDVDSFDAGDILRVKFDSGATWNTNTAEATLFIEI